MLNKEYPTNIQKQKNYLIKKVKNLLSPKLFYKLMLNQDSLYGLFNYLKKSKIHILWLQEQISPNFSKKKNKKCLLDLFVLLMNISQNIGVKILQQNTKLQLANLNLFLKMLQKIGKLKMMGTQILLQSIELEWLKINKKLYSKMKQMIFLKLFNSFLLNLNQLIFLLIKLLI